MQIFLNRPMILHCFFAVSKKNSERPIQNSALQGAWVVTDIKQGEADLTKAFQEMDAAKVHFAILGDEQGDVCLLTRRQEDRGFLLGIFGVGEGDRFQFKRQSAM